VKVETFLKPIEVELAQRAVAKRRNIDEALVKAILREAAEANYDDRKSTLVIRLF
jgi:hypothetical protein